MKYTSALLTLLSIEEHHGRVKQEEPEEGPQAFFTTRTLEQAILILQITTLPSAVTAGYNISRNARGEQLNSPRIHGIPKWFSQRILWVSEAKGNVAIHNLIPQCSRQCSQRLFHFHPGSGCWPGAHPSLSTDSSKRWAVVSQPSVTLVRARPKT